MSDQQMTREQEIKAMDPHDLWVEIAKSKGFTCAKLARQKYAVLDNVRRGISNIFPTEESAWLDAHMVTAFPWDSILDYAYGLISEITAPGMPYVAYIHVAGGLTSVHIVKPQLEEPDTRKLEPIAETMHKEATLAFCQIYLLVKEWEKQE